MATTPMCCTNPTAEDGLRTLMTGIRSLSEEEYQDWSQEHNRAVTALEKRDKLLMDCYNSLESKMKLIGATGIEDRLQEGVPDAIAGLPQPGDGVRDSLL